MQTSTTLTKVQIRNLPTEKQEALAASELQRLRAREELLKRAKRDMGIWVAIWMPLAIGFAVTGVSFPRLAPFAVVAVVFLVVGQTSRIYKRLDAMVELIESIEDRRDHKTAD